MPSRRDFIQKTLFGATLGSIGTVLNLNKSDVFARTPVIITTWGANTKANEAAWAILSKDGYALDAVEAGVRVPEADPNDMSVGYGGLPDREGFVTLDACIMDDKGKCGSVCFLENIMHPVSVARKVMEKTPHVMLVGEGAQQFALEQGFIKENLLTENARLAWEKWKIRSEYKPVINWERHDTCGMLALDKRMRLSGACSTSGMGFKIRGRVGDSPIIGAGLFVDQEVGAASCSGLGELVLRTLGSFLLVEEMRRGAHPQKAAERVIKRLVQKYPEECAVNQVGYVALDRKGRFGAFAIQKGFNCAVYADGVNRAVEAGHYL